MLEFGKGQSNEGIFLLQTPVGTPSRFPNFLSNQETLATGTANQFTSPVLKN